MSIASDRPWSVRLRVSTAKVSRWLHIYLSMVSFGVVLFFAVTGLTLNHPAWFAGQQRTVVKHGVAEAKLLQPVGGEQADKLGLVEMLRAKEHAQGALSDFRVDDGQVAVSFKGPGYTADAFVDRKTGAYELTEVRSGFVAVMNDLHKGRDAGTVWAWVIDVSAGLLVLVSLTGLALIFFLYKRRTSGLVMVVVGVAVCVVLWRMFVP